jgi:two-component system nitrate/nitrite response regulator NarL
MFGDELCRSLSFTGQIADCSNASGQSVETTVLCENSLLRAGLLHLLTGTRFTVDDRGGIGDTSASDQAALASPLFIVDLGRCPRQPLGFVQEAKRLNPTTRIVAVAESFDLSLIHLASTAGVDSFFLTTAGREVLINVLELTILGERVLPGTVLQSVLNQAHTVSGGDQVSGAAAHAHPDLKASRLSPRETVILHSLMGGDANKVIARKLDLAEATVKVHIKAILRKIGAANRTQAALWANENLRPIAQRSLSS